MANEDRRGDINNRNRVFRKEVGTTTMSQSGSFDGTTKTDVNGIIGTIIVDLPASQATGKTSTLVITDEDGYTLYTSPALTENTVTVLPGVDVLVAGLLTLTYTASADPGTADWIVTSTVFMMM